MEIIKILLAQDDIDVNAMDLGGRTPLDRIRRSRLYSNWVRFRRGWTGPSIFMLLWEAGARTGVELRAKLKAGEGAPV
ncbi:hypothetical protein BD779DRAFT_1567210 [Infundibulicybe gibba]|nr:hypothetical protein BD779DRAFT_1569453 [Infundibulicybe gibba]KAF8874227.1 hypothetical protein BD779DRAFT_1567210 [Infundibulicybe gibba]